MNILFVNYGDLRSNSFSHIALYANELSALGHSCSVVSETSGQRDEAKLRSALFAHFSYQEILCGKEAFADARPAAILHVWTPRENARRFAQAYQSRFPTAKLIIHLEDDEDALLESVYQRSIDRLRFPLPQDSKPAWQGRLAHPIEYQRFLASADGITLLAAPLGALLPKPKPTRLIRPLVDLSRYHPEASRQEAREQLGLPLGPRLIAYPGGVTSSNREDLRALFLAVKLLNDEGIPCLIAKSGPGCAELPSSFAFPLEEVCVDLGYLEDEQVALLLAAADVLAQPGKDNAFNRGRFPCKIPEFLASGRPCVIPRLYDPAPHDPESICLLLEESSPREIARQITRLIEDPDLGRRLARRARAFAEKTFAASSNAPSLIALYEDVLAGQGRLSDKGYSPRDLRTENEKLRQTISEEQRAAKALAAEVQQLRGAIADLEADCRIQSQARAELTERLQRMRSTASWRITTPLRALRRQLMDPFTRKRGAAPAASPKHAPIASESADPRDVGPADEQAPPVGHPSYHKDYHLFAAKHERLIRQYVATYQTLVGKPAAGPLISILLPVYNVEERWLRRCIQSVLDQVYSTWELCIADDGSTDPRIRPVLEEYAAQDDRIKLLFRDSNGHISRASNSAFTLSTGDYLALLDHDDELAPHALARVAETIAAHPKAKLIYSDEDKIDEEGWRHGPHFKSDWNYELFLGCNMISHLGVYRRDAFEAVGGFRQGFEGAQDWDLALRVVEQCQTEEIVHIPEILYHWRSIAGSTAQDLDQKRYANAAQRRAIESHLTRIGVSATVEPVHNIDWKVAYALPSPAPRISLIILTKDRRELIESCVDSVLSRTRYPNFDLIVVDNGTSDPDALAYLGSLRQKDRVRLLSDPRRFNFSALNNRAIAQAESELVCLLNNDIEVIEEDWLTEMARHAVRPEIGVVGAKLLFPHDHVQHGGVILGIGGIAAHAFKYLHRDDDGHIHRAHLVSGYSATTGACMLFRKELWRRLGGFDAENLSISYNDVDFCLRAGQLGLRTIVTPFALLYHKESASRGSPLADPEQAARFEQEAAYMRRQWGPLIERDPYYNPNLTRDREDFSYRV